MNPIEKFENWYKKEVAKSTVSIPSACCLTSIGLDGYPNSRFVSLKEVINHKFVITGPLNSKKGVELKNNSKTALAFWWTETERQIRIQGDAIQIEDQLADKYFASRSKDSQVVSQISQQGAALSNFVQLKKLFDHQKNESDPKAIKRPDEWSGFYIVPKRIEFMEFKKSRFHLRELYTKDNDHWMMTILQP